MKQMTCKRRIASGKTVARRRSAFKPARLAMLFAAVWRDDIATVTDLGVITSTRAIAMKLAEAKHGTVYSNKLRGLVTLAQVKAGNVVADYRVAVQA